MDNPTASATATDLESKAARVADPSIDLKTKLAVATELRDSIESVRDSESARVVPHMVPVILEVLRSGTPSNKKESVEYAFRRVLLDVIHRIPMSETIRPQAVPLFQGMLHLIRTDNEEIGVMCCKIVMDIMRILKPLNEDLTADFLKIFSECAVNKEDLVTEYLSEGSRSIQSNEVLMSIQSFKVLAELAVVIGAILQTNRANPSAISQEVIPLNLRLLALESSAQKSSREEYEVMGNVWVGVSPTVPNSSMYVEFLTAQVKIVSTMSVILRLSAEHLAGGAETVALAVIRLLQDFPPAIPTARRELLFALRHFLPVVPKRALLSQVDRLFDERILLGSTVAASESVRLSGFSVLSDALNSLRAEIGPVHLSRICGIYLRHFHNPYYSVQLYMLCAKVIYNAVDLIITKETHQAAARLLTTILESSVEKLEAMAMIHTEMYAKIERQKNGMDAIMDAAAIEKARAFANTAYMTEKPEDVIHDYRPVFRTLLHGIRHTLSGIKKCDAPVPDGALIARMLVASVQCMAPVEQESRELSEVMDSVGQLLSEVNLHVFQEVWTQKMEFIFDNAQRRPPLFQLCHFLIMRDSTSPTTVAIVLRFLVDRLHLLGDYDTDKAALTIRLFKMVFSAVAMHPAQNEPLLAAHLGKLIMDCFPLIATASKPVNYYVLLKSLFRAIGGGGGRFELIYKEVLPLLPDMLECLNRQLRASDPSSRDMAIELCLTVPLRLTHLLPYLSYLMQPLAMALRGNHDLVSQGLRTLELCIDNLTPDFLDPTLNTVLRELMEGLHSHLKPFPASHNHAHTTIRILGKLGGRNRRLLTKEPLMKYRHFAEPPKVRVNFSGVSATVELGPVASLAFTTLSSRKASYSYREHAFDYMQRCLNLIIIEGIRGREREEIFVKCLEGMLEAVHIVEFQDKAIQYVRGLSRHVFVKEIRRTSSKDDSMRRSSPSPLLSAYLDALPQGLAREVPIEAANARILLASLVQDITSIANSPDVAPSDAVPTFHNFASRLSSLCLEGTWVRRSAGCVGIKLLATTHELGVKWINDREVDLTRTLFHVLKDMPYDLANDVEQVVDTLMSVLTVSGPELSGAGDNATAKNKLVGLAGILFAELSSSNAVVRRVAHQCIDLLVTFSGRTASDLLLPHRERMLTAIYTKPLRALPFPIQIGMIEAVRYCLGLDPPLPELNDELLRLLHESLALADADDVALMGRGNPRQSGIEIVKLRVACIKLLTASMPLTDFFSKHPQTRQRVTSVYFKSLYSTTPEVKEVAHEGLRMVLTHQARLPKELLQTGLRPILMNLADPKRLSVAGLEGLARLLELLTNYFKVEIGHKLLDHFRIVADPQMLQASSRLPISENEGITKLVRLANIFHLLPSAANIFLENLVNAIVQTEAQLHFSSRSPFSEPLAKYLDRYPTEAIDFFFRHLHFPRHVRTLRSILQAQLAPNLLRELSSRTATLISTCLEGRDPSLVLPGLMLCIDIAELLPGWLTEKRLVIESIVKLWEPDSPEQGTVPQGEMTHRYSLMISVFIKALEQTPRVDLVYELLAIFTREHCLDLVRVTRFLYQHVALTESLLYRRNILLRFCTWFDDKTYPWSHKTFGLRYILTPLILVRASQSPSAGLVDSDFVQWSIRHLWIPMHELSKFATADDLFVVEVLHFTTVMVQHYFDLLNDAKKDIIKLTWYYINNEDSTVKYTAHLLAAQFFSRFESQPKFLLSTWTALLRPPPAEVRHLARQAQDALSPVLLQAQSKEAGIPMWARQMRKALSEDGVAGSQIQYLYPLIIRQPALFYPVRALFIPHIVNHLPKLGLLGSVGGDSRLLSVEILQTVFDWEQKALSELPANSAPADAGGSQVWLTSLALRESMLSYLVRMSAMAQDPQGRNTVVPRSLALLRSIVGRTGWTDVVFKLHFFARALQQADLSSDGAMTNALNASKVLHVIASDQTDAWYTNNVDILTKLVRKGMISDEPGLLDSLHPITDRLLRLFPPVKDDEEQSPDLADFHAFVITSIADGLKGGNGLRGALMMLKSLVQIAPAHIEPFTTPLMKLLGTKVRDHIQCSPTTGGFETTVRQLVAILEISQIGVAFLADQRKFLLSSLVQLIERSKSTTLCQFLLDMARDWALSKRDTNPTMKEKATLLQRMVTFELRGERWEGVFHGYLELVYDIYTEPSLRRSELTVRIEQSFLLGCGALDSRLRERFIDLLDLSIPRSLFSRMSYILGVQNWEGIADRNWIYIALHLLLGSLDTESQVIPDKKGTLETGFTQSPFPLGRVDGFVRPMQRLLFLDPQAAHDAWLSIFPTAWACLSRREQVDITHHLITLLSKDYHLHQSDMRPNVIQTLLEGALACSPSMTLPPHLVKYLAKNFGAWHTAVEHLSGTLHHVRDDEVVVRDTVYDSLAELYAELGEEDMFYGLWRTRCLYPESNQALAFEQAGMWEQASNMYEAAQSKARAGVIPFSEPEYCLWEDHWMLAAEKLQHWDALYELARSENNHELMLESAWRTKDWAENRESLEEQVNQLPEIATPRRRIFEAFIALLKMPAAMDKNTEFTRILEDAMQLSLRKWVALPRHLSAAHVPLLQHFQQFVELQEAVQIFGSLSATNAQNLEKKSSDLKMVLQAWRERLPNQCDDITIWSDLVAWRQNVFNAINKAYIPLISNTSHNGAAAGTTNTFGYRGFHETAWIINRFAHVARKHELLDVCFSSLNKIYTLPNIEISEAFLKLREQARCHYQKPGDLQAGLEVINNTNLMYFSTPQKAEFYTLKGMFYAKFGRNEEANQAFGSAVQLDMQQAKAWAAWGKYNDRLFKELPNEMAHAASAVSCYLQAAGLYKSSKSRPLLTRVLWLLSVDDGSFTISRAFDTYKGDAAFWYWITLIPQLCLSISQREVKQARYILLNLAKLYPQALFFNLRTTKEDMVILRRQNAAMAAQQASKASQAATSDLSKRDSDPVMQDTSGEANANPKADDSHATSSIGGRPVNDQGHNGPVDSRPSTDGHQYPLRQSWEYVEEVVQILKTAFPLLIMSMETIVEQINSRLKAQGDEDIYRLMCMLLQDGMQQYNSRSTLPDDDGATAPATLNTLVRLATNLQGQPRKDYEDDFIINKPALLSQYIQILQRWRDKYERFVDSRPRFQPLDVLSHYLTDFQYGKFDEIEVPGQYTEDKDSNQNFVRMLKFDPKFENCRTHGYSWRRVVILGNDGSSSSFAVQHPSGRHCRREERTMQLFRTLNGALTRKKESRKRNLTFHIPAAVPCSPNLRLLQQDSSYVNFGDIFDMYCEETGIAREDPTLVLSEKIKSSLRNFRQLIGRTPNKTEYLNLRKELFDEIQVKIVPSNILTRYMVRTMDGPSELWRMRKQVALQIAACSFMTYVTCLSSRNPSRFHLSRATGQIAMSELLPGLSNQAPVFAANDYVPFRFTPNMQHFLGPLMTEGLLTAGIVAIARSLTEPEYELEQQLCLFARDEYMTWLHGRGKPWTFDISFRTNVASIIDGVVKKSETLACKVEREQAIAHGVNNPNQNPVHHTVTNLINLAVNPNNLVRMSDIFQAWF